MQSAWRRFAFAVVSTISVVLGTGTVNLFAQATDGHSTWRSPSSTPVRRCGVSG
jgi:hypothetical protein